jgi:cytochrome c553
MRQLVIALAALCLLPAAALGEKANIEAGRAKSAPCAACHGIDGNSANPQWPKLAGQHAQYLYKQLQEFKSKARVNPIMNAQAAGLREKDMRNLAAYYATQVASPGSAAKRRLALGRRLWQGGVPGQGLPACAACHGPAGLGNAAAVFPRLSYQHPQYVANQLRAYRTGERNNDPSGMMRDIASRMTDEQIEAVAEYAAGLHPAEQVAAER